MKIKFLFLVIPSILVGFSQNVSAAVGDTFNVHLECFEGAKDFVKCKVVSEAPNEIAITALGGEYSCADDCLVIPAYVKKGETEYAVKKISGRIKLDSSVASLILAEGIEEVEADAFSNNPYLRKVSFPSSVKKLGAYAFGDCGIYIADLRHVEEVGACCFRFFQESYKGGTALTGPLQYVILGSNLKKLGSGCFAGQKELKTILSYNPVPPEYDGILYGDNVWSGTDAALISSYNFNLVVPEGSIDAYKEVFVTGESSNVNVMWMSYDYLFASVYRAKQDRYQDSFNHDDPENYLGVGRYSVNAPVNCGVVWAYCSVENEYATIHPQYSWKSGDDKIAQVTQTGVVMGLQPKSTYVSCRVVSEDPDVATQSGISFSFYDRSGGSGVEDVLIPTDEIESIFDLNGRQLGNDPAVLPPGLYLFKSGSHVEKRVVR